MYAPVKIAVRLALRLYFRRTRVQGLERIDCGQPVLILANHTGAFMDALITAVSLRRRIHFFTRSDVFRHPLAAWFCRRLGMLPVYRMRDGKEQLERNAESNREALEVLRKGGAVLVFAEGSSEVDKILKPLKKGPFRLAAMAAEQIEAPLRIVPLGINYLQAEKPYTDAWLCTAETIDVNRVFEQQDRNAARAATVLMRSVWPGLQHSVLYAREENRAALLQRLLEVLSEQAPRPLTWSEVSCARDRFNKASDAELAGVADALQRRATILEGLKLRRWNPVYNRLSLDVLLLVSGALPAMAGGLFHVLPLSAARLLARRTVRAADFYAPVYSMAALVFTTFWYVLAATAACLFFAAVQVLLGLLLLGMAGVFCLRLYLPASARVLQAMEQQVLEEMYPRAFEMLKVLKDELDGWVAGAVPGEAAAVPAQERSFWRRRNSN